MHPKDLFLTTLLSSLCVLSCNEAIDQEEPESSAESIATSSDELTLGEGFETGWGGWATDHYLQCEPGCGALQWSITRSTARAYSGNYSLAYFLNGQHDDGTIWIERAVPIASGKTSVTVTVSFYLWSPTKSVTSWPVVAYAGVANPETEADFTVVGQADQTAGWKRYSLQRTVQIRTARSIWVGLGIGATWEVSRTYFLDSVGVTIQ